MNARTRHPHWWQFTVSALALALPLVAISLRVDAAPQKWKKPARKAVGGRMPDAGAESPDAGFPLGEGTTVRLNHMRSSWQKVIEGYAEAAHMQLVADSFPEGYFSRFDRKDHTPEAAMRLLNRELDPLGFRLIVKGEFLVLMELKHKRREYRPAVVPDKPTTGETDNPDEEEIIQAAAQVPVRPKAKKAQPGTVQAVAEESAAPVASRRNRGVIQQLSDEEDDEPVRSQAAAPETTLTNVRLKSRDAVTVSRLIYGAFKSQAELVDEGPRGLQGFRVFRAELDKNGKAIPPMPNSPVRFTIGIDQEKNQLVIEATPQETPSVVRLIKTLDVAPKGEGTVKAISTNKDAGQIAESLQPELDRLAAASKKAARRTQVSLNAEGEGDEAEEAGPGERMPGDERMGPGDTESLIGSLKGEVTVESVPDLGILIIRGNEKDVESVMSVIREIERLSIGTAPEVELVLLSHVNSESLASLLTSVYERLSPSRGARGPQGQQQQNVLVIPIARPNAILIVAARVDIESARELANQLDQPSDPRTEYRVFRLKYAIPSQVVDTVEAIYAGASGTQGQQGQQNQTSSTSREGLSPRVRITSDARTNSVIVQARPRDMKEVALLIRDLDSEGSGAAAQIRIFPLKNALADELASVLQQAILALLNPARVTATQQGGQFGNQGGQGQQGNPELREVKSQILQFIDRQGGEERLIQSGILADIRIAADLRTNSVVVTATDSSMELIERLIRQFDRPTAAVAEIKVIPMTNGDAQSTVTLLNGLFGSAGQQRQGQGANQPGQNFPGVQLNNADDASSTLIPLRFSVDIRTNSIIAIGGGEALRAVHAIVLRLDESDIRQRKNSVYRLKNSPANDVALAIQQFLQTRNQVERADPGLISPFEQIEREVVVVPEPVSNSLLISATPRFYKDVMSLVLELDAAPKQVLIQALLVEVQLDNADEWGVELGLQDSVLFDRSLISTTVPVTTTNTSPNGVATSTQQIISATATPGYAFNNQALGNNAAAGIDRNTVGGQGLSSFNLGRINGDLGYGGLVLAAGSESVSALLRAVAARRRVDVLSRPQIRTLDNQLANIQVGQEIPRVNGFTTNQQTGNATPLVQQRSIGIILQVTPRISPDGMVVMEVAARKDALSTESVPLFINPNGSTVESPIVDTTNALTTVSVRSGQTIVLGGMITKRDDNIERKVPLLGDIPIIGQAFRYDFKRSVRTELLIFLTPRVIFNDAEAEMIKEVEAQRVSFIEAEAELIHGPLFGVPAETPIMDTGSGATMFLEDGTPISPSEVTPVPAVPQPPAPGIPMSLEVDDDRTPTTIMHGESQPIPALDEEDLNIDLSQGKKKAKRDAVVPAGFQKSRAGEKTPGRTKLSATAEKPAANKAKKGLRQWAPSAKGAADNQ